MIDKNYQGKGYGKEAFKQAIEFIKTFLCGKASCIWLSYEPKNVFDRNLYLSFGFKEYDRMPDGWDEIPAILKL